MNHMKYISLLMKYIEPIKGKIVYITLLYSLCLFSADLFEETDFVKYLLPEYFNLVYLIWGIICLYFILFAKLIDKLILLGIFLILYCMLFILGYVPPYERGPGQMESTLKVAFIGSSIFSTGIWSIYYIVSHLISRVKTKQQA
jgi:hypothetical protein